MPSETRVHVLETSQTPALSFWMCCYANRVALAWGNNNKVGVWEWVCGRVCAPVPVCVRCTVYVRWCTRPQCINQNTHYWVINKVRIGCYFKYWPRARRVSKQGRRKRNLCLAPTKYFAIFFAQLPAAPALPLPLLLQVLELPLPAPAPAPRIDMMCASRWLHKTCSMPTRPQRQQLRQQH